jgi:hypothetical protein
MLFVAGPGPPTSELIRVRLAEFAPPLPDRFVGDEDSTSEQQLLDIAVAQARAEIELDGMTDALGWKSVIFVGGG